MQKRLELIKLVQDEMEAQMGHIMATDKSKLALFGRQTYGLDLTPSIKHLM